MKLIPTCILIILCTAASGQHIDRSEYRVDVLSDIYFGGLQSVHFKANTSAYGIKGTRFAFDEFLPANVFFSNKTVALKKMINYDCLMDQVVYEKDGEKYVLTSFNIDLLQFYLSKDSSVFFERVLLPDSKEIVFMQVMHEDDRVLYKHYEKKLVMNDDQPTFNWDEKYANEYILRASYYTREPGSEELEPLPTSKREFLRSSGGHREALKKYMKQEKINYKKEQDLIRLMAHYDEIEAED